MHTINFLKYFDSDLIKIIELSNGKIYAVGGFVRDSIMGIKKIKDVDVVIIGIPIEKLIILLKLYGEVNEVGKSFGVIKYKQRGSEMEIDIALPRTDRKISDGHKGFEIYSHHDLPIETDLERRDLTINSIAVDMDGNIIDPFNGQKDIEDKILRAVNPNAFIEDPLRMIRVIQFFSRFKDFTIDPETFELIKKNAHLITEISGERILEEFSKIVKKGDCKRGIQCLIDTGLWYHIFENYTLTPPNEYILNKYTDKIQTVGEFVYVAFNNIFNEDVSRLHDFWIQRMKGDNKTYNELSALHKVYMFISYSRKHEPAAYRYLASYLLSTFPEIVNSKFANQKILYYIDELSSGKYPKSEKHMAINGHDLIALGFEGKQIGFKLSNILEDIYMDLISNDKETILNKVKEQIRINNGRIV